MRDKVVFNADDIPFVSVAWGKTKELVGKFCEAQSDNVLIKITEYLPSHTHTHHTHPDQEEIIYVLSGRGQTETASGKVDLFPGCLSFIPAGVPHATYNPYDNESMVAVIIKSPPDPDPLKK